MPSPEPSATPKPPTDCPEPVTLKLGFSPGVKKLALGWRNLGGISPWVIGACAHKNDSRPEAECAAAEHCADHRGSAYWHRYGQPQVYQSGNGFTKDPVERQTDDCNRDTSMELPCGYNLTFSTNHEPDWVGGQYRFAGPMTVCATLPPLDHWRCQDGTMGEDGLMRGFGGNVRGYDLPKR